MDTARTIGERHIDPPLFDVFVRRATEESQRRKLGGKTEPWAG